jgi:hypothetical protein
VQLSTYQTAAKGSYATVSPDANGNWTLAGVSASSQFYIYFDYVGSGGYSSMWYQDIHTETTPPEHPVEVQQANVTGVNQILTLPGSITGQVTLGTAGTIASAGEVSVDVQYMNSQGEYAETTPVDVDASGNYTISNLPPDAYYIHLIYLGSNHYESGWYTPTGVASYFTQGTFKFVTAGASTTVNADLPSQPVLTGHIYLGSTGTSGGAGAATITLSFTGSGAPVAGSVTTDASGAYVFPGLQSNLYNVHIAYNGSGSYRLNNTYSYIYVGAPGSVTTFDYTIPAIHSAQGHVYVGSTSTSATAGQVQIAFKSVATGVTTDVLTDSSGNYDASGLQAGYYTVTFHDVDGGGFVDGTPAFDQTGGQGNLSLTSDRTGLNYTMLQGGSISGSVYSSSGVLPGATVTAIRYDPTTGDTLGTTTTTTDSNGDYSFIGLLPGEFEIDYSASGYVSESYDQESEFYQPDLLSITGATTFAEIDAELFHPATISGTVTLPAGSDADVAAGDVNVYVEVLDGSSQTWGIAGTSYPVTGSGGSYTYSIPGLAPTDSPYDYKLLLVYSSDALYGAEETPTPIVLSEGQQLVVNLSINPVVVIPSGTLVKTADSPTIYFVDDESNFIPITSFDVITAMGLPTTYTVEPDDAIIPNDINGTTISSTPLSSVVECDHQDYLAGSGGIWPIPTGELSTSIRVTPLGDDTCDDIPRSSTPLPTPLYVGTSASNPYLLDSAGRKDPVPANSLFSGLALEIGSVTASNPLIVAPSFLASLPTGITDFNPGTLVKSTASPTVYMVDSNFSIVSVPSLDLVSAYKYSTSISSFDPATFSSYFHIESGALTSILSCNGAYYMPGAQGVLGLASNLVHSLPTTSVSRLLCQWIEGGGYQIQGALFIKTASSPTIWYVDSTGAVHAMTSFSQMAALSAPYTPEWATVVPSFLASLPVGPQLVVPGQLIKKASSSTVYLVDGSTNLIPLAAFDTVAELGLPTGYSTVSDTTISSRTISSSPLSSVISCSGTDYIAGNSGKVPVASGLVGSIPITTLDPTTCAVISTVAPSFNHAIFVKSPSSPTIWYIDSSGNKDAMPSFAAMQALSTPDYPNYAAVADSFLASLPVGPQPVSPGQLIKSASSSTIYLVDGWGRLLPISAFDFVSSMGLSTAFSTVSDATISARTVASSPLSSIVSCSGTDYVAGSGKLTPVASGLVGSLLVTVLDPTTCAAAPQGSPTITTALFVKSASAPTIYEVNSSGQKVAMPSFAAMQALWGSGSPAFFTVAASFVAGLPTGPDAVFAGELVKSTSSSTIYLVDGSGGLIPITSFSTVSDMGLSTAYVTVSPSTITGVAPSPLTNLVSCSGTTYIAGSGMLSQPVSGAVGSLAVSALASTLCAVLPKATATLNPTLIRSASTGTIYNLVAGTKTALTPASLTTLLNGRPLAYINVNDAYLATTPGS